MTGLRYEFERDFSRYEEAIKKRAIDAFKDDLGTGDITSDAILSDSPAKAVIHAEEKCVLAGILEARTILENGGVNVSGNKDGDAVNKGDSILILEGPIKQILSRERTALNYLSRMSGIATLSRKLDEKHDHRVLFLRKTAPGLLFSEKRAVSVGGCQPHRMNLSDGILIKDNHITFLAKNSDRINAIREAIRKADENRGPGDMPIEIEAESIEEAEVAATELKKLRRNDIIMLDNMTVADVKKAVKKIKLASPNIIIEASGGITEDTISSYLKAGADYVSTSVFTSARPCRFKLEIC